MNAPYGTLWRADAGNAEVFFHFTCNLLRLNHACAKGDLKKDSQSASKLLTLDRRWDPNVLIRTVDATNRETTAGQFGLGDIQAGSSRQVAIEHGRVPDLLANFHYKSVTGTNSYDLQSAETSLGTGFHALQASFTAAKSSDPVFFGNVSYTKNLPAHHTIPVSDPTNPRMSSTIGYLRPGDTFGFQLGSILALNTETSVTLGWDQRFTRQTKLNGSPLASSYLVEGSLRIGTSYMYAPGRTLDVSFGVGLTPDTPNLQFSVGFPFRKALWKPM